METSLTEISEDALTDRVFANPTWRVTVGLPPLATSHWEHRLRVDLPRDPNTGRTRGDVDILAIPPGDAANSTASEVKCIRVAESAFRTGEPNGLANWLKGIGQANRLAQRGFSQVYIYLFVAIDSRANNEGRFTYKGATPELLERIRSALQLERLDPRIGFVENAFVQPVDRPPFELGTTSSSIVRMATRVEQPPDVTKWVEAQFRASAN